MQFTAPEKADAAQVREISHVTRVGVVVNLFLAIVKAAGGILAGSTVLIADSVHTVSDLATDFAILVGVRYWSAPADATHPHGHRKIETMITVGIGAALALVGLAMGYNAVGSLIHVFAAHSGDAAAAFSGALSEASLDGSGVSAMLDDTSPAFWLALGAAALSIVSKELLYRWTAREGVRLGSSAVVANAWHHRSDAVSSIPPLLALAGEALGGEMGYNLWFFDPVGTVVVCVMLLQAAWDVARPALAALVDSSADRRLCSDIRKTTLQTRGVIDAHRIRTRIIGSNAVAVDLHIKVDRNLTVERGHQIAGAVKYRILALKPSDGDDARPVDVMVHIEPGNPEDMPYPPPCGDTTVDWKPNG